MRTVGLFTYPKKSKTLSNRQKVKVKMEETLVSPCWLVTTCITPSFPFSKTNSANIPSEFNPNLRNAVYAHSTIVHSLGFYLWFGVILVPSINSLQSGDRRFQFFVRHFPQKSPHSQPWRKGSTRRGHHNKMSLLPFFWLSGLKILGFLSIWGLCLEKKPWADPKKQ